MTTVAKGDFIELSYTGRANGNVFDSNRESDLKQISEDAKPSPTKIILGQGMLVPGLDKALEGKELNKDYIIKISAQEGFGPRHASLIRPIPLTVFTSRNMNPRPGMSLILDRNIVQVRAVSGARVIVDFNNPLAGKDLEYTISITRIISDVEEKTKIFFEKFIRHVPKYEIGSSVVIHELKQVEPLIQILKPKFKELVGKELDFKELSEEDKKSASRGEATQQSL